MELHGCFHYNNEPWIIIDVSTNQRRFETYQGQGIPFLMRNIE